MKNFIFFICLVFTLQICAEYYPIIFLHGQKSEATYESGWNTWGNELMSPFNIIGNEQYNGYKKYSEFCNNNTNLHLFFYTTRFFIIVDKNSKHCIVNSIKYELN